jgi:hypothetical protein
MKLTQEQKEELIRADLKARKQRRREKTLERIQAESIPREPEPLWFDTAAEELNVGDVAQVDNYCRGPVSVVVVKEWDNEREKWHIEMEDGTAYYVGARFRFWVQGEEV